MKGELEIVQKIAQFMFVTMCGIKVSPYFIH